VPQRDRRNWSVDEHRFAISFGATTLMASRGRTIEACATPLAVIETVIDDRFGYPCRA
jgi:hypothetical protein